MSAVLTRRGLLGGALSAIAGAALADAPLASLRPLARAATEAADLSTRSPAARPTLAQIVARARISGNIGIALADAATGQMLEMHTPGIPLPPASVAKALTALYALDALGPEHRFETRLIATGPVEGGVLDGDLILAGGGDPVLDTDDLAALALEIKAAGVAEVRGGFHVFDGALPYKGEIDPTQMAHLDYNPAICGLNLNFNRVHFQWTRSGGVYEITMGAPGINHRPPVTISSMKVVDRSLPVYTYEGTGQADLWTVAQSALGDGGARWLPVRKPALYAGEVFAALAAEQGLTLEPARQIATLPQGSTLVRHQSAPLRDILRDMLEYSTNLTAEVVGLAATTRRLGLPPDLAASARAMNEWLAETYGASPAFVDHSGLSDLSRISAGDMATILAQAGAQGPLHSLLKSVTLTDDEYRRIENYPATMHAKTGTLNFVSGLAGYVQTADGADLAFAIFAADFEARERGIASGMEIPDGARPWNARTKRLQQDLLRRWGLIHAG